MSTSFKDHFSKQASSYATFRPKSPPTLFSYITSLTETRELAWDVGTGNGQAAIELAPYFKKILASDASPSQIEHAVAHPKVTYRIARAEEPFLEANSVNLITVAQALHWFDFEKFYAEARRVAAPKAVIAAWTYELASITPEIDELCNRYYRIDTAKYWSPERKWVEDGYKNLPFPFRNISAPRFEMVEERDFDQWTGYLYTWSATQKAIADVGPQIFENFVQELREVWGEPKERRTVKWPLFLRLGSIQKS